MDGLTQSQSPGLDAKSKPWKTRSLVPNSSDTKSSLSCPFSTEKIFEMLTKKKIIECRDRALVEKNVSWQVDSKSDTRK
jgi:hypothetical protein